MFGGTYIVAAPDATWLSRQQAHFQAGDVQGALDALPTRGGSIALTEGHFARPFMVCKDSVAIRGQGEATVLRPNDAANLDRFIAVENVWGLTLENMAIDGNGSRQAAGLGYGIEHVRIGSHLRAARWRLAHMYIYNTWGSALQLDEVDGLTLEDVRVDLSAMQGPMPSIRAAGCYNLRVQGCMITANPTGVPLIVGGSIMVNILDNHLDAVGQTGIDVGGCIDVLVKGNIGRNMENGIWLEDTLGAIICNNNLRAGSGSAIRVLWTRVPPPDAYALINGNHISGFNRGATISGGRGSFRDNVLYGCGPSRAALLLGAAQGVYADGWAVGHNEFYDSPQRAIEIQSCRDIRINHNRFSGTGQGSSGIDEWDAEGRGIPLDNVIEHNRFSRIGGQPWLVGPATVVRDNIT